MRKKALVKEPDIYSAMMSTSLDWKNAWSNSHTVKRLMAGIKKNVNRNTAVSFPCGARRVLSQFLNKKVLVKSKNPSPVKKDQLLVQADRDIAWSFTCSSIIMQRNHIPAEGKKRSIGSFLLRKKLLERDRSESVPIKVALRDKDWLNEAKEQILNDLYSIINRSSGVYIMRPIDSHTSFTFYIRNGNNSPLVRNLLASRQIWTQVKKKENRKANFIWTPLIDMNFIKHLPVGKKPKGKRCPVKIHCNTKFRSNTLKNVDLGELGYDEITNSSNFYTVDNPESIPLKSLKVYNKIEGNHNLSNKKSLFLNMKLFYESAGTDPFKNIPLTFHIINTEEVSFNEFAKIFQSEKNYWIVKPGENSNRGRRIIVCSQLEEIVSEIHQNSVLGHTTIVQKYISNPFLIKGRKFDIRCFCLITSYNGVIQAYFYQEGYLRTASGGFSLNALQDKFVHLTNDAVQKKGDHYGKFENANKLSYYDFQRYLDSQAFDVIFEEEIVPQMRNLVADTVKATQRSLNPHRKNFCFEVFGYDFLIDSKFKPWLLEVNTNPCLELASPQLARIITAMLDNALRISLDPLFYCPRKNESLVENKFELIFNSLVDTYANP